MKNLTHSTLLLSLIVLATAACPALAEPVVRVLFFTGDVSVKTSGSTGKPRIGQQLESKDEVTLSGNATLQLSIDGKVIKYAKPMKLKVADAIKRAGSGENLVVANTLRTIAGASGAGRNERSSVAGATRADDSSQVLSNLQQEAVESTGREVNDEITRRTGIENPGEIFNTASSILKGEDLVVLEPRSTAVASGPIMFRWLRNPDASNVTVTVRDYMGEAVFTTTTADTAIIWDNPTLLPEAIYTWTLEDPGNPLRNATSSFHQLSQDATDDLNRGDIAIRSELGADNPALPLILGAYYSDHGCYGTAARLYTSGALQSIEHFDDFMERAYEEYRYNIFMPEKELSMVYRQ